MDTVTFENGVREIALDDIVIDIGQVRTKHVGRDIHGLAESIKKVGMLQPIVVCQSQEAGKYEIIAGQRRFLAHKEIGAETIKARVIGQKLNEFDAKILSLTENWERLGLSTTDERDVCLILYRRYKSVDKIVSDTKLSASKIHHYLRWDSLPKPLQELVDNGELKLDAAYRAKKALEATGEADDNDKVIEVAKELNPMSNQQRIKFGKNSKENPEKPVDEIIEEARSGEDQIELMVQVDSASHKALRKYAVVEKASTSVSATRLITEGLVVKGFLDSE